MAARVSSCFRRVPRADAGWRRALVVAGLTLAVAGCGRGPASGSAATASPSASARAPGHTVLPVTSGGGPAQATQAKASRLQSMDVAELLGAARTAYAQHRLVAPAGDNAVEYYIAVLAKDPGNQVAANALREAFPYSVPDVESAIAQSDFDDAAREIALLDKADPGNYTLTLLRAKLDAQKKAQARQQQEARQKAQRQADIAAAQEAAARAAAARDAAPKVEAPPVAVTQPVAPPKPVVAPVAAPPPKPAGETRLARVVSTASAVFPAEAARNQTSGFVVVEFTVGTDGSVQGARVIESSPRRVFDAAALHAIEHSKFEPALKDGQPVASTVRRRIDFKFGG